MFYKLFITFLIFSIALSNSFGQNTIAIDTLEIEEVVIATDRLRGRLVGTAEESWNTDDLQQVNGNNVADLLSRKGGVYIKHYGPGTLSTVSVRGASSSQTSVLWNGMPLTSPTLGLMDLSLIPLTGFESVSFQKGSNGALWGSGAIGGNLQLENSMSAPRRKGEKVGFGIDLNAGVGLFGLGMGSLNIKYGGESFYGRTKLFLTTADNDFIYQKDLSLAKVRLKNAEQVGHHFFQDFYWCLNKKNQLIFNFWRSDFSRNIPPTLVQNESQALQFDLSNRAMISWVNTNKLGELKTKIGIIDEFNDYQDKLIGLESSNYFQSLFAETALKKKWNKHQLLLGFSLFSTKASTTSYSINNSESKYAAFTTYNYKHKRLELQGSLRTELVNKSFIPLVPSIGMSYLLNSFLHLKANIGRNYRLPTLNDRYWLPGGNPTLFPESGWSQELALSSSINAGAMVYEFSVTGFNRNVDNWILWALDPGTGFFGSQNIAKVWSRGLEPRLIATLEKWKQRIVLSMNYDLIFSTNEKAISLPNIAEGTQLWYTPRHQGSVRLDWVWKKMTANYTHQFTSASQGINEAIDRYHLGHLRIDYRHGLLLNASKKKGKRNLNLQAINYFIQINNLWNERYFIIERRPLPGINGQLGIQIKTY